MRASYFKKKNWKSKEYFSFEINHRNYTFLSKNVGRKNKTETIVFGWNYRGLQREKYWSIAQLFQGFAWATTAQTSADLSPPDCIKQIFFRFSLAGEKCTLGMCGGRSTNNIIFKLWKIPPNCLTKWAAFGQEKCHSQNFHKFWDIFSPLGKFLNEKSDIFSNFFLEC